MSGDSLAGRKVHGRACAPSLAAGYVYGLAYLDGYPRHGIDAAENVDTGSSG